MGNITSIPDDVKALYIKDRNIIHQQLDNHSQQLVTHSHQISHLDSLLLDKADADYTITSFNDVTSSINTLSEQILENKNDITLLSDKSDTEELIKKLNDKISSLENDNIQLRKDLEELRAAFIMILNANLQGKILSDNVMTYKQSKQKQ